MTLPGWLSVEWGGDGREEKPLNRCHHIASASCRLYYTVSYRKVQQVAKLGH